MGSTTAYFEELRAKDPDFYWRMKLVDEYRVENVFWIDDASCRAYTKNNNIVSFDTTYMTNMYKMMCAPFIALTTMDN